MEPLVAEGEILLIDSAVIINGNDLGTGLAETFAPAHADTGETIELPGRYRVTVERIG